MMEYRVIYYTESYGSGIGSPQEPWVAYSGPDHVEAKSILADVRNDLGADGGEDWTVHLQTREVTLWATVQGMRSGVAQVGSALGS